MVRDSFNMYMKLVTNFGGWYTHTERGMAY
jgi:hypothetical protein